MAKTNVLFIPGLNVPSQEDAHPELMRAFEESGCNVYPVNENWVERPEESFGLMLGRAQASADAYRLTQESTVLVGHSMGALVAAGMYAQSAFRKLVLCSPSPSGDALQLTPEDELESWQSDLGYPAYLSELPRVHIAALLDQTYGRPASVLVGEREDTDMQLQAHQAACALGVEVRRIPDAGHAIDASPAYLSAVIKATVSGADEGKY